METWLMKSGKISVLWMGGTKKLGRAAGPEFVAWLVMPPPVPQGAEVEWEGCCWLGQPWLGKGSEMQELRIF